MHLKVHTLIAALAALLFAGVVAFGDVHEPAPVRHDNLALDARDALSAFERLHQLVLNSEDEKAAEEVREALSSTRDEWLVVAAAEAVRQAEVDKPGSGRVFVDDVIALLDKRQRRLHEEEFVTVNVLASLGALSDKEGEDALKIVTAIVEWQRWSGNESIRLRDIADRVLLKLTGEDCTLKDETLAFWDWYIDTQGRADLEEKAPEKQSRTAPVVFKEPIIGTRTVFVIDVSDSMKWDIKAEDKQKLKKEIPHLEWGRIDTPRDLAVAELVHSLEQLKQVEKPKVDRRRTSAESDRSYPHFAIITYSTEVELFTDGWESAHEDNIDKWIRRVEDLELYDLTNIHGAVKMSMGLGSRGRISPDPSLDNDALMNGAHTIVFLTDGYPTWSDDSTASTEENEWGHAIGDGEHVKRDKLLELTRSFNRFRKVLINTVGIGIHDKELMRGMARDSGGTYTDWYCIIDYQ